TIVNGQSIITTNDSNSSGNMKPDNATAIMIDLNGVRLIIQESLLVLYTKTNSTGHLDLF
uniref:hypothetical protein n=1 Tax=Candidatus Nitrosocosmicus sp. FF01 TaxID=3397670 RepID=UPI0039E921A0